MDGSATCADNCLYTPNPCQEDSDGDGVVTSATSTLTRRPGPIVSTPRWIILSRICHRTTYSSL